MSIPQTSVAFALPQAIAGLIDNSKGGTRISTGKNVESSAEFPFGILVTKDLTAAMDVQAVKLPTSSSDRFAGIVAFSQLPQEYLGTTGIKPKQLLELLEEGEVWVPVENAVTKGGRAFARITANGGNTQLGKFRADADSSNAVEIKGSEFLTTTTGAGLAKLRFSVSANRATQS